MSEDKERKLFILGIYPRCPFYKSITAILIILAMIVFGTWGSYYLNLWAAIAYLTYSLAFYFLLMPFTMCKHCYFKKIVTSKDEETGEIKKELMPVKEWGKTLLHLHVGQKHWVWAMFLVWLLPIVLTVVSFFRNLNYLAIIALIGFIAVVAGNYLFMVKVKCPTCPIQEECHSSF